MINFIRSGSIIVISSLVLLSTLLVGPYNTLFFIFSSPLHLFSSSFFASAQRLITLKDMVTYHKQSNFIKEFEIPLQERGLKGITTDAQGNAWFYHSTNHSSTIVKFDATSKKFTQYNVGGNTVVDDAVINLAGGQLLFDNGRNTLWFTDARTNSIGRLDLMKDSASSGGGNGSGGDIGKNGKVMLISIPTSKSGPMGIVLSPDGKTIWFAEILGDKIASLDIQSNKIVEYPTGENTGPTFLTFNNEGILWVTMSYSLNILRVEPWALVPGKGSFGMSTINLPKPDMFSPFGIALVTTDNDKNNKTGAQEMFVSDHGSSRVISSITTDDLGSNSLLQPYTSYWTSPSQVYPTTLPAQIVADKSGSIIYFPEHGGNKIAKINTQSGIMTEYDIPTGPLSTAVFIGVSDDGKRVWFTEWASNMIAYLDTTVPIPFNMKVEKNNNSVPIILLKENESKTLDILVNAINKNTSISSYPPPSFPSLSLAQISLSVIGMSDSGLKGVLYAANPPEIDLNQYPTNRSQINLRVQDGEARPGQYTAMIKASAPEKEEQSSFVSLLYPISLTLDVPTLQQQFQPDSLQDHGKNVFGSTVGEQLQSTVRLVALPVAIGLIGFVIYGRIKRSKREPQQ